MIEKWPVSHFRWPSEIVLAEQWGLKEWPRFDFRTAAKGEVSSLGFESHVHTLFCLSTIGVSFVRENGM